jgi:carbon monoxide dehydrogenase subunit G
MWVKILVALGILVIVVLAILALATTRPPRLKIERSIVIDAPPSKIYGLVNDFHSWKQWAPGDKDDVTSNRTYSGAVSGVGAVSTWRGNGNTSVARMEITGGATDAQVIVTVDFTAPFVARNVNTFTFEAGAGGATRVTWDFDGQNVYMMKVMGLFTNMDKMMGKHFEDGLGNLKVAAEKTETGK